jgi:type IX secretion system PorP/SprF family membrane protein
MKRVVLSAAIILTALSGYAQQDPLITQYMFNYMLVNPAYAGSKDYIMANALYRTQWVKLSGQPVTMEASINGPVTPGRRVGLGFYIENDNIGVTNKTTIMGDYAYHIPLNNNGLKLGLGVNGGIYYTHSDFNNLTLTEAPEAMDPIYKAGTTSSIVPEVGAGAYLYNDIYYVGLSVPELLSYDNATTLSLSDNSAYGWVRHYWATAGYAFVVSDNFVIKPSAMWRFSNPAPMQADINLSVLLQKVLWLGATFRTGDNVEGQPESIAAMIEIIISKQLRIGYSYDFTTTKLNTYGGATHEITIGYDFGYDILKMKSPRYF